MWVSCENKEQQRKAVSFGRTEDREEEERQCIVFIACLSVSQNSLVHSSLTCNRSVGLNSALLNRSRRRNVLSMHVYIVLHGETCNDAFDCYLCRVRSRRAVLDISGSAREYPTKNHVILAAGGVHVGLELTL